MEFVIGFAFGYATAAFLVSVILSRYQSMRKNEVSGIDAYEYEQFMHFCQQRVNAELLSLAKQHHERMIKRDGYVV